MQLFRAHRLWPNCQAGLDDVLKGFTPLPQPQL